LRAGDPRACGDASATSERFARRPSWPLYGVRAIAATGPGCRPISPNPVGLKACFPRERPFTRRDRRTTASRRAFYRRIEPVASSAPDGLDRLDATSASWSRSRRPACAISVANP
jgi:hypothetical protein